MHLIFFTLFYLAFGHSLHAEESEKEKSTKFGTSEEVSPDEDLLFEHALINRLLLIYEEIARRLDMNETVSSKIVSEAATIIRNLLENYHEHLEENYIFPRLKKAHQHQELVKTLEEQHRSGRKITDYILAYSKDAQSKDEKQKKILAEKIHIFIRMFRPHEAQEDTVIYPAFRKLITKEEFFKMGEILEKREDELLGDDGVELLIRNVEELEKQLDIENLSKLTPKLN